MRAYRITIDNMSYFATQLKDSISLILIGENQLPIIKSELLIDNTNEFYNDIANLIKSASNNENPDTYDSVDISISFVPLVNNLYRKDAIYTFNNGVVKAEILDITRAVMDGDDKEIQDVIVPSELLMEFSVLVESFLNDELNVGVEEETLSYGEIAWIGLKDPKTLEIKCGPNLVRSETLCKYKARLLLSKFNRS